MLLDGLPVKSCTVLGVMTDGRTIDTVEGLEGTDGLDPVQRGFMECHGLQWVFHAGMMMVASCSMRTRTQRRRDPRGPFRQPCRCTGYHNIVKAVRWAADRTPVEVTS